MGYNGYYSPAEDLSNYLSVRDDIIQYIGHTLAWIPSINPCNSYKKGFGLNNYGITLFDKEGAEVILKLAKACVDLFSIGPNILKLTGNYSCIKIKSGIPEGEYNLLEVDRDELVENFRKLRLFSGKVISGDYLILHLGI